VGVEYLRKTNPGTITFAKDDSLTTQYLSYYFVTTKTSETSRQFSQALTVVPITLNFYGYLPLGRRGEAYLNAGPGLYLGRWKSTLDLTEKSIYNLDWYRNDGSEWPPSFHSTEKVQETDVQEATCNAVGFHFGAGFAFALSPRFTLFGEASYRLVNFKNWKGTGRSNYTDKTEYGWTDAAEPSVHEDTGSDNWSGQGWYYDEEWPGLANRFYSRYGVFENEPDETYGTNVRQAEININGLAVRVGVRITFTVGRGPAR